ncbi:MAG TPA: hypothetical protein VK966_04980 [Longimicrobiales bacterium]|nr:hypothetical protein [Longimicrobiales bacterium]
MSRIPIAGVLACVLILGGCDQVRGILDRDAPETPAGAEVEPFYAEHSGVIGIEMSGNVAVLRVRQPMEQLTRGGSLWARVGPYIYLFSPSTQAAFQEFPGLAAVRVITVLPGNEEVARATLTRDRMTGVRWRRAHNLLGTALQQGRENPRRLEELTEWGEEYTVFEYNPDYVGR